MAGDYTVTVTDTVNCSQDSTFKVNEPAVLDATINSTGVTCVGGNDGSITISAPSGGSGSYEYSIDGGTGWQGSGNFTNLVADTFNILIRDALATSCVIVLDPALILTEPNDLIPPVAVCRDITVQLDASGNVSIDTLDIDDGSTDNCGIASRSLDITDFTCADVGPNSVTLTVIDNSGNSDNCPATVTVEDNVDPLAVCQDITAYLDAGGSASITGADIDGGSTDACGIASLLASPNSFTCAEVGLNAVTLTVTDNNGNSSQCLASGTVLDTISPVASCQDITAYLDAGGSASITGADIDGGSTDACGIASLLASPNSFTCAEVGLNAVTLTVTDNNGNSSQCLAWVTVLDTITPVILCPPDTSDKVDGSLNYTIPDYTSPAAASDNCNPAPALSQSPLPGTVISGVGTIQPITLMADDGNGNTAACVFNLTLLAPDPPTITCPGDTNAYVDNNCEVALTDYTGFAIVTGEDTITQFPLPGTILSGAFPVQPVTLTAINALDDSAQCTFNVTLLDTLFPSVDCRTDTLVTAPVGTCSIAVNNLAPVSSTDNCAIAGLSYRVTGATAGTGVNDASGTVFNKGLSTVWYRVSDSSGNLDSCSFAVTVVSDLVPPDSVWSDRDSLCPGDGNIQLSYSGGVMVEGGTATWYEDTLMTDPVGTGNPLVLPAPLATTDYFVRFEGTCDTTPAATTRIEILPGSVVPDTALTDRNDICPGDGMISLSYSGGLAGYGASAAWYADSALSLGIGSGNDLAVAAPMVSTPYFVRFEGTCDTTPSVGLYLAVNALSQSPSSASSDPDSVCAGAGFLTLTYTGGTIGTGAVARWYDDVSMTSSIASGNNASIAAPETTTTYYVRFEGDCDTTSAASVAVTVFSLPAPVFTESVTAACIGGAPYRYVVAGQPGSSFAWSISSGTLVTENNDTVMVDWGSQAGSGNLGVSETTVDGCVSEPVSILVSIDGPTVDLGPDQEICAGAPLILVPEGDFSMHMWNDGSTGATYSVDSTELVKIQVFDDVGCTAFDSVQVIMYPVPVVDLGNDTILCGEASVMLDAGNPGAEYTWSTGETTQRIEVFAGGQIYSVEVSYGGSCTASDEILIRECSLENYFKNIPNLITPNGDGVNDTWFFYEATAFPEIIIEIYDRWGKLVFRSEPGYSHPWDGRSMKGKEMPMDSYHYVIRIGKDEFIGTVTIVR